MARTKQSLRSRRNGEAKPEIERKLKEEYDRIKKLIKTRNQQMEQETTQSTPSTESDIDIENAQYVVCISTSFDTLQPGSKQAAGYGCVWVKYASLYTDSRDFRPWIHKGILCRRELGGYDIELKAIQSLLGYSSENCHITIISNSNRVYNCMFCKSGLTQGS
ncbi:hypothetical protein BDA99DRAFT_126817 [Phascolomyces articulosus]|uniref:Uncharacterized protein n=1 Tax=Phascolomyces articulosus TaxID=60185 RepID=A0AAD5KAY9_9FUNG|nr:hypothetical protein BDA99DRAFT_126817 [Phascolomyces articulosus]